MSTYENNNLYFKIKTVYCTQYLIYLIYQIWICISYIENKTNRPYFLSLPSGLKSQSKRALSTPPRPPSRRGRVMSDKFTASSGVDPSTKTISVPVFHLYHKLLPGTTYTSVNLTCPLKFGCRTMRCLSQMLKLSTFSSCINELNCCVCCVFPSRSTPSTWNDSGPATDTPIRPQATTGLPVHQSDSQTWLQGHLWPRPFQDRLLQEATHWERYQISWSSTVLEEEFSYVEIIFLWEKVLLFLNTAW